MIEKFYNAIFQADELVLEVEPPVNVLSGFSGLKVIATLQRLSTLFVGRTDACYLEVGVFQGLNLLSNAYTNPDLTFFGIDNFTFLDEGEKNEAIGNQRIGTPDISNAHLINLDYEYALLSLDQRIGNRKVGAYSVDGPHDYRTQRVCLDLALPYLDDHAVIVVDDSNYSHVRQANHDFLVSNTEFKLIFEAYTPCHPIKLNESHRTSATSGWWNSVHIIARDLDNCVEAMYPQTIRDRTLFENDHLLRSSLQGNYLPTITNSYLSYAWSEALNKPKQGLKLIHVLARFGTELLEECFANANTWRGHLVEPQFSPRLSTDGQSRT